MSSGHRFLNSAAAIVSGCALLCLTLLASKSAWAGTGFQSVNPDELKMTSEPLAPGAAAIILFREVDRDDNRYTPHEDNYLRIKILTEEGRKHADIEIPFSKAYENIVNIHARTIKPGGAIVEFDGKVFEKVVARIRQSSYVVKAFNLPDVEVGSIIEYFYTVDFREHFVYDSHWILSEELFTREAKFSLKPFTSTYNQFHLRWTWQQLPPGATPKPDARGVVEMEASNIPAFQIEDFMPPENELKARVDFVYDEDTPDSNPDRFWQRVGKKRNGALEGFVGKRKAMEDALAQIVSPNDAPEVKLRKIYDRVQQIRNTSYEIRKTEQEEKRDKEKAATNVEDVWKRGYGDGQQLTWLFLALARAAGFEAYGCWVANRRQYFFNPKLMKGGELDSTIVQVKVNGKDVYFDPGDAFTPYGMLTWSETGVTGLRLDNDGGSWIKTTLPQPEESQTRRDAKLKLTDTGDLEGTLTVTYTGLEAMYRRQEERHEDAAARKKVLEESVKGQIPAAAELELTNQPEWDASNTPLVAILDLKIPGWASSAGRRATLPVGFFSAHEKHIFEHANRVQPIYFEYPYEKIDNVTIELPLGWRVSSAPSELTQGAKGKIVEYDMKVENNNNTIHVTRDLGVNVLMLESKYYPALRNFFQAVRNGDEQQILLQPAETSGSN
jgi:transglutaminase-like putative cysteine protease